MFVVVELNVGAVAGVTVIVLVTAGAVIQPEVRLIVALPSVVTSESDAPGVSTTEVSVVPAAKLALTVIWSCISAKAWVNMSPTGFALLVTPGLYRFFEIRKSMAGAMAPFWPPSEGSFTAVAEVLPAA
ncbi:MAG: hypothetical protein PUB21_11125 [Bacteroidales bacterium]|nr:hypothetical protein [Bacteroidales bacterium]